MSLEWRAPSIFLAWSNPLAWWWSLLLLVSGANIAVWFLLYYYLQEPRTLGGTSEIELMLFLSAAYVFGCAFRSVLPRADIQRICLFDTWLSSVTVGRSVATVSEICFAAQWAIILHQLGTMTGADTTLSAAWVIVPLILIAECLSWHAVLTKNYLGNAIENSIWGVSFFVIGIALCRLLPEFGAPVAVVLVVAIIGIAGYLIFLATVDVPMYLTRWQAERTDGVRPLNPLDMQSRSWQQCNGTKSMGFKLSISQPRVESYSMSALGQKQTSAWRSLMSALPPKADIDDGDCQPHRLGHARVISQKSAATSS